jgi:hypothetical protein
MNRTRAVSTLWRQVLREHVTTRYPEKRFSEIYRMMAPGVSYPEFLLWLSHEDPVVPLKPNLERLFASLGVGEDVTDFVYRAGLDHRNDRRTVFSYLADLSSAKLDKVYEKVNASGGSEESERITLEDLTAVVAFERIVRVEVPHAN